MAVTGTKPLVIEHFKLKMTTELKADLIDSYDKCFVQLSEKFFIVQGGYFENKQNKFLRTSCLSFLIASCRNFDLFDHAVGIDPC
jgi:hypothetical protein